MIWKQVKIFTEDAEQSAIIEPDPEKTGLCLILTEEHPDDKSSFRLYMTVDETKVLGNELIKYAEELNNKQ